MNISATQTPTDTSVSDSKRTRSRYTTPRRATVHCKRCNVTVTVKTPFKGAEEFMPAVQAILRPLGWKILHGGHLAGMTGDPGRVYRWPWREAGRARRRGRRRRLPAAWASPPRRVILRHGSGLTGYPWAYVAR